LKDVGVERGRAVIGGEEEVARRTGEDLSVPLTDEIVAPMTSPRRAMTSPRRAMIVSRRAMTA
jgi:hypothetical protein